MVTGDGPEVKIIAKIISKELGYTYIQESDVEYNDDNFLKKMYKNYLSFIIESRAVLPYINKLPGIICLIKSKSPTVSEICNENFIPQAESNLILEVDPSTFEEHNLYKQNVDSDQRKKKKAVFTMCRDEHINLPIWLNYYSQYFSPKDIWIIDNNTVDKSTSGLSCNVMKSPDHPKINHCWKTHLCNIWQNWFFETAGYEVVLFADADEIVYHQMGLDKYMDTLKKDIVIKVNGYHLHHFPPEESDLDLSKPILEQRKYWQKGDCGWEKPILTNMPIAWDHGHHGLRSPHWKAVYDHNLLMLHLHWMDFNICNDRHKNWLKYRWENEFGGHAKIIDSKLKDKHFSNKKEWTLIPDYIKSNIKLIHSLVPQG